MSAGPRHAWSAECSRPAGRSRCAATRVSSPVAAGGLRCRPATETASGRSAPRRRTTLPCRSQRPSVDLSASGHGARGGGPRAAASPPTRPVRQVAGGCAIARAQARLPRRQRGRWRRRPAVVSAGRRYRRRKRRRSRHRRRLVAPVGGFLDGSARARKPAPRTVARPRDSAPARGLRPARTWARAHTRSAARSDAGTAARPLRPRAAAA